MSFITFFFPLLCPKTGMQIIIMLFTTLKANDVAHIITNILNQDVLEKIIMQIRL